MTKNDLLWLSHFLRRVVTHDQREIEQLWRLVTMIENAANAPSVCTRPMVTVPE